MIKIDRSTVAFPSNAYSVRAQQGRQETLEMVAAGEQKHFKFRANIWKMAKSPLRKLFNNKCAFCETPLAGAQSGDVVHFRPKSVYPWLAYEWDNLYLSCEICNRIYKGASFPILGERAVPPLAGNKLLEEQPLLLDPCIDDPSQYLRFESDGYVYSTMPTDAEQVERYEGQDRGRVTIDVLGLNRSDLLTARERQVKTIESLWRSASKLMVAGADMVSVQETLGQVTEFTIDSAPYAALSRQMVARLMSEVPLAPDQEAQVVDQLQGAAPELASVDWSDEALSVRPAEEEPLKDERLGLRPAYILSIELTNFKCFSRLKLNLPEDPVRAKSQHLTGDLSLWRDEDEDGVAGAESEQLYAGWSAFLGENAAGKSTILEAIALCLNPADKLESIQPKPFIMHGKRVARVRLRLTRPEVPEIVLRITSKGFKFEKGASPSNTVIRGYGYVRMLARSDEGAPRPSRLIRLDNLFDPRASLCDVEGWLLKLRSSHTEAFRIAATTIKDVLPEEDIGDLEPTEDGKGIRIRLGEEWFGLEELSAGYQSVVSLAADIMSGIHPDMMIELQDVPGIVLLDEVGTQLHPRWRMRVVSDLRDAFPRMQFIISTHEPLCLRGLDGREIVVLRRSEPRLIQFGAEEPSPARMRVDQLLTSRYFGLDSTIDPDINVAFQQYYYLLAKEDRTEDEQELYAELRRRLWGYGVLGYTRRDQVIYQLIDEWLAEEQFRFPEEQQKKLGEIPDNIRERVREMWEYAQLRQSRPQ